MQIQRQPFRNFERCSPQSPILADVEETDDWLNRHNVAQTVPRLYEAVREFIADIRYAYHG